MTYAQPKGRKSDRRGSPPVDPARVGQEVERLASLDQPQLRLAFRNRTGRIAPAWISRSLLLRVIAYRVQAEVFGDLRPETRRMLDRLAGHVASGVTGPAPVAIETPARPRAGTVLVREWQGRMEQVRVSDDSFQWNGQCYSSLSAVAGAITGSKWNGRRFFGLDRPARGRP